MLRNISIFKHFLAIVEVIFMDIFNVMAECTDWSSDLMLSLQLVGKCSH